MHKFAGVWILGGSILNSLDQGSMMRPSLVIIFFVLVIGHYCDVTALKPECLLPTFTGDYISLHVFWSYSPTLGQCVKMTFGGPSRSGQNHFHTLEDCEQACVD
ncbi:kappaPI-actitoxin-Avd3b-like [Ostrea edulis]|uniref:kappaPI-actitoxin-Avd3b-like n=1 Tax=Ostrea edulis TaxID=37623 RepID=UPI00209641EF|nr:kappaPI-actitoxin-Avd3b-like [Ostrea edulis]